MMRGFFISSGGGAIARFGGGAIRSGGTAKAIRSEGAGEPVRTGREIDNDDGADIVFCIHQVWSCGVCLFVLSSLDRWKW
jgi:hypothetical protein